MQRIAVFGYGSLVSEIEIVRTLGHRPAVVLPALVRSWVREWSVAVQNNATTYPRFELASGGTVPEQVIALNITQYADMSAELNGILFSVTAEELAWMDAREAHYDRIDITKDIVTAHPFETVYTYTGKSEHIATGALDAILPSSYVAVVEAAFKELGTDAFRIFEETTLKPMHPVVPAVYVTQSITS